MNENPNYQWLKENGSPAIRLRTATELMKQQPTQQMVADLLSFSMTQLWMSRLPSGTNLMNLHGSKPNCLENVGGKLRELGFDVSMAPAWQQKLQPYVDYLKTIPEYHPLYSFTYLFITAPLVTIGFNHPSFVDLAVEHLALVGEFCRSRRYDIYIDPDTFGGLPSAYAGRKLLNPDTNNQLPTIWDLYLLAYLPRSHRGAEIEDAEKTILSYILTDKYQALPEGYGILYDRVTKKYYAHGWNVSLPNWFGNPASRPIHEASYVQRLELMANFPEIRYRKWFQNGVKHLRSFRTEQGTYRFPAAYLKENPSGYYVTGAYMRLEEDRRRKIALELDSTFRMELIRKKAGYAD